MKWIIDLNMRDGYIKYTSVDRDLIFEMRKKDVDVWDVHILTFDIKFIYYGIHDKILIENEVMERTNEI